VDEYGIENHPDLMDPDWQRHAEQEAWTHLRRTRRRALLGRRLAWSAVILATAVVAGAEAEVSCCSSIRGSSSAALMSCFTLA
jgi:hypothetical protein